ncbi:mechanosensitive ion channel family protein [Croceibacterium mercuriale]|uniref:mechanosensitive ion channel family protein n=1 Tax=Croceibacterium mercuriale TaxID=1572751 RepID=UPI000A8771F1
MSTRLGKLLLPGTQETPAPQETPPVVDVPVTQGSPVAVPVAQPAPVEPPPELVGAEALSEAINDRNATVGDIVTQLDAIGVTLGSTRFSLWTALVVVLVIVGVFIAARLSNKFGHRLLRKVSRFSPSQELLGEKLVTIGVWTFAILIGVDLLGIDLTALAVFSGAFGLAIGFGLQKTFGNLIAGIILLMDRSIKPGDVIAVTDMAGNETFGQIRKIGVRAVSIITRDEKEYLIPNENLMVNQVENWSYSSRRVRVQIPVGISYNSDIIMAETLMMQAARGASRVLTDPAPTVWLSDYGESWLLFTIHCWIVDPEEGVGNVKSDVLKRLWLLFKENGIEVPYPQRDLNLRDNAQFDRLIAALEQRTASSPADNTQAPLR